MNNNKEIIPNKSQELALSIMLMFIEKKHILTTINKIPVKSKVLCIAGKAGTGKSTLIKFLLDKLPSNLKVLVTSPTGKAANALGNKLKDNNVDVLTIHSSLLQLEDDLRCGDRIEFTVREEMGGISLIIIDEMSMVTDEHMKGIEKHNIPIIALGDFRQLPPPINKDKNEGIQNVYINNPFMELDIVERQKAHNPILRLADFICNVEVKRSLFYALMGSYDKDKYTSNINFVGEYDFFRYIGSYLNNASIILCGYNVTRVLLNHIAREHKGFLPTNPTSIAKLEGELGYSPSLPQVGESIIFLKNAHRISPYYGIIFNGSIGKITKIIEMNPKKDMMRINLKLSDRESEIKNISCRLAYFFTNPDSGIVDGDEDVFKATYAYVVTVHKSQASEYSNVVLFCDKKGGDNIKSWMYTAVTRAIDQVTLVRCDMSYDQICENPKSKDIIPKEIVPFVKRVEKRIIVANKKYDEKMKRLEEIMKAPNINTTFNSDNKDVSLLEEFDMFQFEDDVYDISGDSYDMSEFDDVIGWDS